MSFGIFNDPHLNRMSLNDTVKWNKSDAKEYIVYAREFSYNSLYMELKMLNQSTTEIKVVVTFS